MPHAHSFAALCALALLLSPASPRVPVKPGAAGPEGVIAMHQQLLAALDRGDGEAAAAFVGGDLKGRPGTTTLMIVDAAGTPVLADDAGSSGDLLRKLAAIAKGSKNPWTSTITRELQVECYAPEISWAVLEIERAREVDGKKEIRRFRSTALVRREGEAWKLFHWHLSPADDPKGAAAR
jgi:hypothetical protein